MAVPQTGLVYKGADFLLWWWVNLRRCKASKRTARKRRAINLFLLKVYIKAAGMLPNKPLAHQVSTWLIFYSWFERVGVEILILKRVLSLKSFAARFARPARGKNSEKLTVIFETAVMDSDSESDRSQSDHDSDVVLELGADQLEQDEELKLHVLGLNSYWSAAIETNFGTRVKDLAVRWLPPGSIKMLYYQMTQEAQIAKAVSYQFFWQIFRQNWNQILRFLPSSTHGACDSCCFFKSQFKKAMSPQEKFHNAKAYKEHIDAVCADRDLEAYLQGCNPLLTPGSALCLHFVACLN